jgi:cytochrome c peroxidase
VTGGRRCSRVQIVRKGSLFGRARRTAAESAGRPKRQRIKQTIADGPIKTFPLCGAKDNAPYFHDERLLTLEDTVEFFNLVLGTKLAPQEKQELVAFLRAL